MVLGRLAGFVYGAIPSLSWPGAGIVRAMAQSRHPGESRDPGASGTEHVALDTGFRRYDGVCCGVRTRHAGSLPRRSRPGLRGDGAPRSAKSYGSCLAARGRLRGAPITAFSGTGPRFSPVRRASPAPTEPSASSWQGLLVAPEGAPMPPECFVATKPAGAAPRPASRRLMIAPLSGRGGGIISAVRKAGVMRGYHSSRVGVVIPAKAGIQGQQARRKLLWIPAFAGMTEFGFRSGEPTGVRTGAASRSPSARRCARDRRRRSGLRTRCESRPAIAPTAPCRPAATRRPGGRARHRRPARCDG